MAAIELNLVIDKSAIQSLGDEECFWLHHFTRSVLTPVLHMEILGNLKKDWKGSRSPEDFFRNIAKKAKGHFSYTSLPSDFLMREELLGYRVEMAGRPIVGGTQTVTDSAGQLGVLVLESLEQRDLLRWSAGDFSIEEERLARAWQDVKLQLEAVKGKRYGRPDGLKTLAAVAAAVDAFLNAEGNQWQVLGMIMQQAGLNEKEKKLAKSAWQRLRRPPARAFAPYGHFVLRCTLLMELAESAEHLKQRGSNVIDLLYFYYLPFCQLFVSDDQAHTRLAPYLVRSDQAFLTGTELKESLKRLVAHYNGVSDVERSRGAARYARFLPLDVETPLHSAFDRVAPDWRAKSLKPPPPPISSKSEAEILAELRPMWESIERASKAEEGRNKAGH